MSLEALFTLVVLGGAAAALAFEVLSPDVLLLMALAILLVAGIVDLGAALQGFSNSTLLAIGSLYVVAAGLREAGVLERTAHLLLGGAGRLRRVLLRLCVAVAGSSAFLNNTPIVAMSVPAVRSWSRRHGRAASRLLMPLSFASILGGLCTLIGTSTNLVTDGLLRSHGFRSLGFFELARVGAPLAVLGIAYLVFVTPRLLRRREDVRVAEEREQAALLELELSGDSPLAGRTVEDAGLVVLPGLRLVRIDRENRKLGPVSPQEELRAGDRLFYAPRESDGGAGTGATGAEVPPADARPAAVGGEPADAGAGPIEGRDDDPDLDAYPGLRLALTRTVRGEEGGGEVHEAVVREGSPLAGARVRDVGFLARFGAAVTGVRRGGERLEAPLGEIRLRPGDTLMLDTGPGFREAFEDAREFWVATRESAEEEARAEEVPFRRSLLAVGILAAVVLLATTRVFHIAVAALLGAVTMVAAGFLSPGEARRSIDWSVLLVIGTAFGLAAAMESSGAARFLAESIVGPSRGFGPGGMLVGVLLATMALTGLITNNAAAALMFPIALSVARGQGLDPRPFLIGITVAASLSLWTPLGYQTNLMVYGPGNYRFTDFTRLGLPLQLLLAAVAAAVIPLFWPF